jgi:ABC-type Fe3+/spermidine/putrescine transport system ATPase subunit
VRVREEIRAIQQRLQITTVFVTHDQDEALSVADRIAVMNGGKIEQYAGPDQLYREPETRFVADFVGTMNFYTGDAVDGEVRLADGGLAVSCAALSGYGRAVTIGVRPEDVRVSPVDTGGGPAAGPVTREVPRGHYKEIVVQLGSIAVRAFVDANFSADRVSVRFARALVYRDDHLVRETAVRIGDTTDA